MAAGIPARDAIDLYNKLVHLPFSAKAEIGQITWRLQRVWRGGDIETAVAYLQALIMLGRVPEAHEVTDYVWSRKGQLSPQAAQTFAMHLTAMGRYKDAERLASEWVGADSSLASEFTAIRLYAALWLGELDAAEKLDTRFASGSQISTFRAELARSGLADHFADHQRIVRDIVADVQCHQQPFIQSADGGVEFHQSIFIAGDRAMCRRIEESIDDALANHFQSTGMDGAAHVPLLTTLVRDISSHWALVSNDRNAA